MAEHVLENKNKKVLIEFIKKASAEEFYRILGERVESVFLMTGDSSIQERKDLIEKIKGLSSVILVATQVIEAGVDIDMDIGFKDISRLDSEEQFMGRINRSGKKTELCTFSIWMRRKVYTKKMCAGMRELHLWFRKFVHFWKLKISLLFMKAIFCDPEKERRND